MKLIIEEVKVSELGKDFFLFTESLFPLRQQPRVIDPSELLRPEPDFSEKGVSKFRDYTVDESDPLKEQVRKTYRQMHLNQTVDFVQSKWSREGNPIRNQKKPKFSRSFECFLFVNSDM
jgi:hypothetical protein